VGVGVRVGMSAVAVRVDVWEWLGLCTGVRACVCGCCVQMCAGVCGGVSECMQLEVCIDV